MPGYICASFLWALLKYGHTILANRNDSLITPCHSYYCSTNPLYQDFQNFDDSYLLANLSSFLLRTKRNFLLTLFLFNISFFFLHKSHFLAKKVLIYLCDVVYHARHHIIMDP